MIKSDRPRIFFDGVCNLCNGFVRFLLKQDKKELFQFSSLQSKPGEKAIEEVFKTSGKKPDSVILFYEGRYYWEADAVLKIASLLGGIWNGVAVLRVFPRGARDAIYRWVARNRYRWFGKKDECMIPTPEIQARFPDD